MYKVICDFCGTENLFSDKAHKPKECSNQACQNSLEELEVITLDNEKKEHEVSENKKLVGLKLIYQKTSEEILIKPGSKIILGRESYGSELLGKIAQISRSHCSIEFVDNKVVINDLSSTNGTFIGLGADKINCTAAQVLSDKDFLVLGKEVFLVQFIKDEKQAEDETGAAGEQSKTIEEAKEILCTECSAVLTKLPCSCPDCGTWNE